MILFNNLKKFISSYYSDDYPSSQLLEKYKNHYVSFESHNSQLYVSNLTRLDVENSSLSETLTDCELDQKKIDFTTHAEKSFSLHDQIKNIICSERPTINIKINQLFDKVDPESHIKKSMMSLTSEATDDGNFLRRICEYNNPGYSKSIFFPDVKSIIDRINVNSGFDVKQLVFDASKYRRQLSEMSSESLSVSVCDLEQKVLFKIDLFFSRELNSLSFDDLLLLESFCEAFPDASSILLKPSVVAVLGFKSFVLVHERLYNTPSGSSFNQRIQSKIASFKWTRYLRENNRIYKFPLVNVTKLYYFSNNKCITYLRNHSYSSIYLDYFNNSFFSSKLYSLGFLSTSKFFKSTILGSYQTFIKWYTPLPKVGEETPRYAERLIDHLVDKKIKGTGYSDVPREWIGRIVYDVISLYGTVTDSALRAIIEKNPTLMQLLVKMSDDMLIPWAKKLLQDAGSKDCNVPSVGKEQSKKESAN